MLKHKGSNGHSSWKSVEEVCVKSKVCSQKISLGQVAEKKSSIYRW